MSEPVDAMPGRVLPPERTYMDLASTLIRRDEEELREVFVKKALSNLSGSTLARLMISPSKTPDLDALASRRQDLHVNRHVEIGIVTRGSMYLWWEGRIAHCPQETVFVIAPGVRYLPHVRTPDIRPEPHAVVWLAMHRGRAVAHNCALSDGIHHLSDYHSFTDPQLTSLCRTLTQELATRLEHYEDAVRGSLLCLFTMLIRAPVQAVSRPDAAELSSPESGPHTFGDRIKAYFHSHYHRPLALSQVARAAGCSPAYLCRRFREDTGATPFQYLKSVRIDAAKHLLQSDTPIARVAGMVGFDDPFYFSRVFTTEVGEAPRKFQARHRRTGDEE